jgi:hypothetical protein
VEFGNYWWESMDYRYRLCSTNCHHAQREDNGELVLVVSHDDPGVPNWLDPSGHVEGYIALRWINAGHYTKPNCLQVPASDLHDKLGKGIKTISPEERRQQLAARRRGALNRFPY